MCVWNVILEYVHHPYICISREEKQGMECMATCPTNLLSLLEPVRGPLNPLPAPEDHLSLLAGTGQGDRTEDQGRPTERPTSPRSSTAVLSTSTVPVLGHTPSPK
jgi:hypothetical protein